MSMQSILLPLFVQVALTFALLFWLEYGRVSAVRRGEVNVRDIAFGQDGWPEQLTLIANSFRNQFQLPLVFYLLVVLALMAHKADLAFVIMSWLFVALRILHAAIHVSSNKVPRRFYAFAGGAIVLVIMWIVFAMQVLLGI
jgi:hypothetical protein